MYCANCAAKLAEGTHVCPSCGFTTTPPAPKAAPATSREPLEEILRETERAVQTLAIWATKLTKHAASYAEKAAHDPSGTVRKTRDRVKKEISEAVTEVSNALKKL